MRELRRILSHLVAAGLPGAFVYICDRGGTSSFHTSGVSNRDTGSPMTPTSHYRAGSTTKTFTAVVVLQLIDEGVLALRDPVSKYLTHLEIPHSDELRIEHLLRMRSGLFDFVKHPSLRSLRANRRPWTLAEVVRLSIQNRPTSRPDAGFSYCNTNYCLLELIIEQSSGFSLGQLLQERIFSPLQMNDTSYPPEDDLSLPEPYIRGYDWSANRWLECSQTFFGRGDGALISTAVDLSKFFQALLVERRLVSAPLLSEMLRVHQDSSPAAMDYGLGLIRDPLLKNLWGHSGRGFGYRHLPFVDLETGRFAVFMTNGTFGFQVPSTNPRTIPDIGGAFRRIAYATQLQ